MSRTLKVTGNHVMYDGGAWFLRVIMSSLRALCCLPSVKRQKHDFQGCFVDRARHRRRGLRNTKRSTKVPKELFADHMKEKKLREPEEKKELAQTLTIFMSPRSKKERTRSMYNKTIIRIRSMYNKTIISLWIVTSLFVIWFFIYCVHLSIL